ncbi:putative phytanoyl-CoA dioxygenase [Colletotrichum aenigma]|uniref:putative phytanoyl-CoA dioxygenase n=1 Tax=Colletotrichum aenigma TaxID=1215731 RepID=UPI0018722219|nr:putative phytanoyl-CoA dioxygenase [Colletotrichum aenigma]KAF5526371.1 putative phytanoyl-CoA dioxygenase [Colletotrichum aenigma]
MVIATDYNSPAAAATITVPAPKKPETSSSSATPIVPKPAGPNKLFAKEGVTYGDFRDDLVRDGYVVVKGAIPRERTDKYADDMMSYLENFAGGLGFDRNDPSTVKEANLPIITEKGMCLGYGIAHESFTWAVRQEPGLVSAFERVYDTPDLIVSFDAVNMAFPNRADVQPNKPWPHQDQDPQKPGFRCLQGLVNLLPNGPRDGGLIVCKGAHRLSEEFHEAFKDEKDKIWAWTKEWYGFTDAGIKWLEERGCVWEKIDAEPGDLLLWDSRTPHYNLSPEGERPRFCVYTCYMPVADASQEDLVRKKGAFESLQSTTHWPNAMHVGGIPVKRGGEPCPYNTGKPREVPRLSERGFKLTGIPYIQGAPIEARDTFGT